MRYKRHWIISRKSSDQIIGESKQAGDSKNMIIINGITLKKNKEQYRKSYKNKIYGPDPENPSDIEFPDVYRVCFMEFGN